jgi:uncharacterized phage-associated protein
VLLDACVPVPIHRNPRRANRGHDQAGRRYRVRVPVTANQVAAALREHLPGVSGARLHRLLYYVQGHHLALIGRPAFTDPVTAGVNGPEVRGLANPQPYQPGTVGDSVHAVAVMVAARYGGLTAMDLDHLARAETPWRAAFAARAFADIPREAMREYFAGPGRQDDADHHTPAYLANVGREVTRAHHNRPEHPDDLGDMLAKVVRDGR